MNIEVHIFFWIGVLGFLGYFPSSGITGSKAVPFLIFLRKFHTVFHSGYMSLHFHQHWTRVLFSPHPCQHFYIDLLMIAILTCMRWYLIVVLICISLMVSDVEQFFMCLWALCISSLEECLHRPFAHFWLDCLSSWCWVIYVLYTFLRLNPCPMYCWQKCSSIQWVPFSFDDSFFSRAESI